jgi:gliding motility-associated-like protein
MKKEINNEPNWQNLLREHQMPPSPKVWERIEAAQPTPLVVPKAGKQWVWWSAAAFVAVSLVAGYFLWMTPDNDAPETMEIFVPIAMDGAFNNTLNHESDAREANTGHLNHQPTDEKPAATADLIARTPAETTVHSNPTQSQPTSGLLIPSGTQGASSETLPQIKPVTIPDPGKVSLPKPATATAQADSGKSNEETNTQKPSEGSVIVFIPNAFTPGNGSVNSVFKPVVKNNEPVFDYKMQIFSRSGQLLFETADIEEGWDGTFRGVSIEDRVCVYDISFRDQEGHPYRKWGTVVVIKQGM